MLALFNDLSTQRRDLKESLEETPLLQAGLLLLIGCGASTFPWLLLLAPLIASYRIALLAPVGWLAAFFTAQAPLTEPIHGDAYISIERFTYERSHFGRSYCYTAKLRALGESGPRRVRIHTKRHIYPASRDYIIPNARLTPSMRLTSKEVWRPVPSTFSLAEWRFQLKRRIKKEIRMRVPGEAGNIMSALATGDIDSIPVRFHFAKLGLSHLLALSGFHFALLATLLTIVTRRSYRTVLTLLLLYALYIGPSPSVSRAHIAITLFLIAKGLFYRQPPLNALGGALLIALIIDPHITSSIAFQLSFGATLGILLLYRPCCDFLTRLIPRHPHEIAIQMPLLDQHAIFILWYVRKSYALLFAVYLVIAPLLLYHFGEIPLLTLLYSPLITPLVSLLFVLVLIPPVWRVGGIVAQGLWEVIVNAPRAYAYTVGTPMLEPWMVALWCSGISLYGLWRAAMRNRQISCVPLM